MYAAPATCSAADGSISTLVSNSGGSETYLWSDALSSTSATLMNVVAGTYTVMVTDANGCTSTCSATVGSSNIMTANISGFVDETCGGVTGSATVAVGNSTGLVTYLWTDAQTGATAINLSAGTYTVTATDANGCTATASVTIGLAITTVATCNEDTPETCPGDADGAAIASGSGGTAPYSYLWSDGQTNDGAIGLTAGTYSVIVTDANGCADTCTVTVTTANTPPVAFAGSDTSLCDGASISLMASGGGTYAWSTGATTASISVSPAVPTTYFVTVTDAFGCTDTG